MIEQKNKRIIVLFVFTLMLKKAVRVFSAERMNKVRKLGSPVVIKVELRNRFQGLDEVDECCSCWCTIFFL